MPEKDEKQEKETPDKQKEEKPKKPKANLSRFLYGEEDVERLFNVQFKKTEKK